MQKRWERMEKRSELRYNLPIRATLSFTDAPTQDLKTLNISSGGAFIMTKQAKPEGTEVIMSLLMDTTLDRQIGTGDLGKLRPTEVVMLLFNDAKPNIRIEDRIWITLKGMVKRSYNYGMSVGFNNQYCMYRM
jgi:hypothetical protein